jgi:hypothetical protein
MASEARPNIVDGQEVEGADPRLLLQRSAEALQRWQERNRVQVEVINRMMTGENTYDEVCQSLADELAAARIIMHDQQQVIKRLEALKTPGRQPSRKW